MLSTNSREIKQSNEKSDDKTPMKIISHVIPDNSEVETKHLPVLESNEDSLEKLRY